MRGWLALVIVVGSVVGCGDNASPPTYGVSGGSRLEPRFWDAGGGARLFRSWFDRELGVECRFDLAADGRFRCLPSTRGVSLAFANASCTRLVAIAPMCAPPPTLAIGLRQMTPSCGRSATWPVYTVGAERTSTAIYRLSGDRCVPDAVPVDFRSFDVGAERAPDAFVAADLVAEENGGRLAPYVFAAEDGARQIDGIWDTQRDGECGAYGDVDASCAPVEIALHYDFIFNDATCTVNAAVDLSDFRPCHPPTAIAGAGEELLEIGTQVPASEAHRSDMIGTCDPVTVYDDETFWLEGPPIPRDSLAPLVAIRDGAGRVHAVRWTDDAGQPMAAAHELFDTELGRRCDPRAFADGEHCIDSSGAQAGAEYADAACTVPVAIWNDGPPPPFVYTLHVATSACDAVELDAAYEIGAPVAQSSYFRKVGVTCLSTPLDSASRLYGFGARVEFPRLTD
jgi:hypothetical protein